jgi:hypothetical protein
VRISYLIFGAKVNDGLVDFREKLFSTYMKRDLSSVHGLEEP